MRCACLETHRRRDGVVRAAAIDREGVPISRHEGIEPVRHRDFNKKEESSCNVENCWESLEQAPRG